MTVVDVDLTNVDVYDAIEQGYYYGDDHVVLAQLTIETAWLRSWTVDYMPQGIRDLLGIIDQNQFDPDG